MAVMPSNKPPNLGAPLSIELPLLMLWQLLDFFGESPDPSYTLKSKEAKLDNNTFESRIFLSYLTGHSRTTFIYGCSLFQFSTLLYGLQ